MNASLQDTPGRHGLPVGVVIVGTIATWLAASAILGPVIAQSERLERHRVPAEYMSFRGADWLERSDRVDAEQPDRVLDAMGIGPGDVVADVGCGSGYYARRLAGRVLPGGRVYCEDIQPEMLEIMRGRAAMEGISGIEPVLGTPTDPRLPAGEIDWVIIADVYHEMSDPEPMLAGIRSALSPEGRVALLEYRVEDGTGDAIKADHRMSVRQVLQEWKAAGFQLEALHEFLPSQHLFFFRSRDGASASAPVEDYDLFDALEDGIIEAEAAGNGEREVTIRVRRTREQPVLVTSTVGTVFREDGGATRDMVARRDGWMLLNDNEWHAWRIRAVGRQPALDAPGEHTRLEILPASTVPAVADVLYHAQVGTYTVADSPTLYIPTTHGVEQAALWIADANLGYDDIADRVQDERIPGVYAVAFALVLVDRAEVDVDTRRVWADRERIFGRLRDQGLNVWYRTRTGDR